MTEVSEVDQDRVQSPEESHAQVEARSPAETIKIVTDMYSRVDPELGKLFVRPDAVLAIAGLKGMSDSLRNELADKAHVLKQIDNLNSSIEEYGLKLLSNRRLDEPRVDLFIAYSTRGIAYKSSRFSSLRQLGLTLFESTLGLSEARDWFGQTEDLLENLARKGTLTPDDAEIYFQGIFLGYPDRAIEDFADWYKTGRKKDIVEADILSVHPMAYRLGRRITPEFDYYPSSENDPEIVENIETSRRILKDFYDAPEIKKIIDKIN